MAVAVNLPVNAGKFGGDGWESNPPRTPQQRPANSFEDRGLVMCDGALASAEVGRRSYSVHRRLQLSAHVLRVGCRLGYR